MKIYAATGHRPQKLGGFGVRTTIRLRKLATHFLLQDRPDRVISGMALGWDMAWAEAAIALGIPCIAAVPFKGQECRWSGYDQWRYNQILNACDLIHIVCPGEYDPWKLQERNEWMVDNCTKLIQLWDGSSGGTYNCSVYAGAVGREAHNLWDIFYRNEF